MRFSISRFERSVPSITSKSTQLFGHVGRIVARIFEGEGVLVGGIADDQRNATFSAGGAERRGQDKKTENACGKVPKHTRLPKPSAPMGAVLSILYPRPMKST